MGSTALDGAGLGPALEVLDEPLQCVGPAVKDQVLGQLALLGRDLGERDDVRWMDDGQVEPGLDAVVEEDGIENSPSRRD